MALPAETQRTTLQAYLDLEETSDVRHEFHDGEVLAMSGGTYRHSLITANVVGELRQRLKGRPCRALESNMRVATRSTRRYVYPDASVVCGGPEFDPDDPRETTVVNPALIVEVLSESTEAYDRGEKFNHYRRIPALNEYVLAAQDRPLVESFLRQQDGTWSLATFEGADATAELRSLKLSIPLAEIYAGVEFDDPKEPPESPEPPETADTPAS